MTLTNPMAALGSSPSLNPPSPLFGVGQEAVDQAYRNWPERSLTTPKQFATLS